MDIKIMTTQTFLAGVLIPVISVISLGDKPLTASLAAAKAGKALFNSVSAVY
jgi:hypothetical protein